MKSWSALYLGACASAIRPREAMTVSEWADRYRRLSSKASAEYGPWNTDRTPYAREIMDALSLRSEVEEVVVMSAAQKAKTEIGLNWVGYTMTQNPGPMLVVQPTLEMRDRFLIQRFNPMVEGAPELSALLDPKVTRSKVNQASIKDYPGGVLIFGGANSAASLSSMPIRDLWCDEVDQFKWELGEQGDPLGLAEARQSTFQNRKRLLTSTPTVRGASRILQRYEVSDRRLYFVECPHCHEAIELLPAQLMADKDLTRAWYTCQINGCMIEEHEKPRLLKYAEWVPQDPTIKRVRGYHITGLMPSLGLGPTWLDLKQGEKQTRDDPTLYRRFQNLVMGLPSTVSSRDVRWSALASSAEAHGPRIAPRGCLLLTAGVDVQQDRLALQILGHGRQRHIWVLDYVELDGDPMGEAVWVDLAQYLNAEIQNSIGHRLRIRATAIDTGYNPVPVYEFVRQERILHPLAVKGSSVYEAPILSHRGSYQDYTWKGQAIKRGVRLYAYGPSSAKHYIHQLLALDDGTPDARRVHFPSGLPDSYYRGLTAEIFIAHRRQWVLRQGEKRQEALDTFGMALAAAMHPAVGIGRLGPADWDALEQRYEGEGSQPTLHESRPPQAGAVHGGNDSGRSIPISRGPIVPARKSWFRR